MGRPSFWDTALRNQGLIKDYLDKNRWIIDKSHTLEWDDYWQIGLIALYDAARNYDSDKTKFSTYAWVCIKNRINRAFMNQAYPIMRVPEKKHPKESKNISAMPFQEVFAYNVLNYRGDLSAVNYFDMPQIEEEQDSEMFVFFK